MDDRNTRPPLPETMDSAGSRWRWLAGAAALALVLALIFVLSAGDRIQTASYSPPAVDGMVLPPITQPGR